MATFKHISSKNANYGDAEKYLTFAHDEFTMKPTLDAEGRLVPRGDYRISTLNCGEEDFAVACMRSNLRYGKNQKREDVKSHHYIISFDPRDGPDNGLTVDKAQELGERFCREQFPGHQAIVCTHPDGHNQSGNIHVHIVINSLRIENVPLLPYMDRPADHRRGDGIFQIRGHGAVPRSRSLSDRPSERQRKPRYEDHFRAVMEQKLRLSSEAAIRGHKKRLGELDCLFIRIYEDNVAGRITDEKFSMMSKTYEDEQAQLKVEIQTLQQEIEIQERQIENLEQFIQRVRKYEDLDELTPYALRELVKAIYIEAPDKSSGKRHQGIRISYDLVGFIPVEELLKQETA